MNAAAHQKNRPIELLEESLQILRSGGAPVLLQQWTGALPFAVALLLLIHDAGLSWGASLLLRDSLACAVAFLWMSYWKSRTSRTIFSLLAPGSDVATAWTARAALQAIFQTLKLFVMPFAAVSILAWPAASAFFRTLALEPITNDLNSADRPMRGAFRRAFASATQRYTENAVAFLAVAALAIVICVNVLVTLFMLPGLWKMLTGYETDWSRMQDPTIMGIFAVAGVTTWLLIDPWIQTYCVLRVFYQNARADGRDLLRDIVRLAALILVLVLALPAGLSATPTNTRQALNQGIDHVSKGEDYGWLRPDETRAEQGFVADLAEKIHIAVTAVGNQIHSWYREFMYWLRNLFRSNESPVSENASQPARSQELRWMLGLLAALICAGIVAFFFRTRKIRRSGLRAPAALTTTADVLDERILPSEIQQEEWLRQAHEYLAKNETRLAARAFYLANLSYLGAENLLSLSLSKSNKLYERELARKPRSGDLSHAFLVSNRLYERAWYGMRELGSDQMEQLKGAADQLRGHA